MVGQSHQMAGFPAGQGMVPYPANPLMQHLPPGGQAPPFQHAQFNHQQQSTQWMQGPPSALHNPMHLGPNMAYNPQMHGIQGTQLPPHQQLMHSNFQAPTTQQQVQFPSQLSTQQQMTTHMSMHQQPVLVNPQGQGQPFSVPAQVPVGIQAPAGIPNQFHGNVSDQSNIAKTNDDEFSDFSQFTTSSPPSLQTEFNAGPPSTAFAVNPGVNLSSGAVSSVIPSNSEVTAHNSRNMFSADGTTNTLNESPTVASSMNRFSNNSNVLLSSTHINNSEDEFQGFNSFETSAKADGDFAEFADFQEVEAPVPPEPSSSTNMEESDAQEDFGDFSAFSQSPKGTPLPAEEKPKVLPPSMDGKRLNIVVKNNLGASSTGVVHKERSTVQPSLGVKGSVDQKQSAGNSVRPSGPGWCSLPFLSLLVVEVIVCSYIHITRCIYSNVFTHIILSRATLLSRVPIYIIIPALCRTE